MKVTKWVDFGQDVAIDITLEDVRQAMCEAFSRVTANRPSEPTPTSHDVCYAFDNMAKFLKALTDSQIATLTPDQRKVVHNFLTEQSTRFAETL